MATNMDMEKPLQKKKMEEEKLLKKNMEEEKAYAEFVNKVKRTILLDNLAPAVTSQIIKTSLAQFGTVLSVQFIPNYTIPQDIPQAALVEMETPKQAESLVTQMGNFPFMMSGMPRPVRASPAKITNFADHPRRPGSRISYCWVKPGDADFEVAKKRKSLVKKHAAESAAMLKYQFEEEEKLAKQHEEMLKSNYMKYEMIDKVMDDGSLYSLAAHYKINLSDAGI